MRIAGKRFVLPLGLVIGFAALEAALGQKLESPAKVNAYEAIDRHALNAPAEAEKSIPTLAEYLTKPAKTDRDKARAIFRWMTDRIAYDIEDSLRAKPVGDCSAEGVLKSRKSVCAGYATLFEQLAREAKLEVVKISGFGKIQGYVPGDKVSSDHAWNAVKIEGQWFMVDSTWGAGSADKDNRFVKELKEHWFLMPPDQLIFSHFPDDPSQQFLKEPVDAKTFRGWPMVPRAFFPLGIQVKDLRDTLNAKDFRGLVDAFEIKDHFIRIHKAPLRRHLTAGASYELEIEAKTCADLAVINNDTWEHLKSKDGVYRVTITPRKGKLEVCGKFTDKGTSFWTVLEYGVE